MAEAESTPKPKYKSQMPRGPRPSLMMVRVGGQDYPLVSSPYCRVCQSPHRQRIENDLLLGKAYGTIIRTMRDILGEDEKPFDKYSLNTHVHEHLPSPVHLRRKIIEQRAREVGVSILGEDSLVNHVVANDLILQRGYERLVSGEIDPSMSDLLASINLRMKIDATSESGYEAEAYQQAIFVYFDEVRKVMSPEQFEQFGKALMNNPILKAIAEKRQAQEEQQSPETVQGEVTESP